MRVLVNFLSRTSEGAIEQRKKVFETGTLTLGRGTDQTIHLRDPRTALEHATIDSRDGRLILRALTLTGVLVNDVITRSAVLKPGDRITVGENLLTVIDPPPGFDLAMTFELDPEVTAAVTRPDYKTRLADTSLRPRRWAWIGASAILLLGLLVPSLVLLNDRAADLLRGSPLPDDGIWLSGSLHPAHRPIGDDCAACHTPFRKTPDRLCMNCHTGVQQHIAADAAARDELSQRRCGRCHKEHNEPPALVRRDQIVCTDCHAGIRAAHADTSLRDVSGFVAGHPGFSVSLLTANTQRDEWLTTRVALADKPRERSGLVFPHDKHMDPEGIKGADGDVVLQCEDCHLPQGGGAVMRAVDMERDCQACHPLDFEPADPARQAPHAQTGAVLKDMEEYYAWRYLNGLEDVSALGIDPAVFRRPGRISDRGARERLEQAASDRALAAADELIHKRACANCHDTGTAGSAPGTRVIPVRLTQRWLPKGRFDHAAHGVIACTECHAADVSESSEEVLIPDIDTCGRCHDGAGATDKIATACVDCHGFHNEGAGQWPH